MATQDTVVQELVVNTLTHKQFKAAQEAGTLSPYELYGTPDTSVRLPVLTPMWFDHITNDVSWLRADTFSWHSGDVYKAAYNHLVDDLSNDIKYYWGGYTYGTYKRNPAVGDDVYSVSGFDFGSVVGTVTAYDEETATITVNGTTATRNGYNLLNTQRETIAGVEVIFYLAPDGHKIVPAGSVGETAVEAIYNATGVAWYYIVDPLNNKFKLPRTKYGFVGMRDGVGNYVPESLPNITGEASSAGEDSSKLGSNGATGAFYSAQNGQVGSGTSGSSSYTITLGIDASRSSATYQDGAPVQQRATQMYLYFYVGNFTQDAIEQTAGINAELFNGKADLDLGNLPANYDYVVESQNPTAENGYTWYRKYKSGWVEQGGINNTATLTYLIPMTDTNYIMFLQPMNTSGKYAMNCQNLTTTGASINTDASQWHEYSWQVSGMAA